MAFDRRGVQVLHLPVSPKPAIISIIVEDWTIIVRIVGDLILYCIGVIIGQLESEVVRVGAAMGSLQHGRPGEINVVILPVIYSLTNNRN
jgi:hypothetical protein